MNEYDTDKMFEVLRHENYFHTDSQEDADLIILNTCSIREKAEHKVYSELGRLRDLKSANPELKIGVGGCVAQQEGEAILRRDSNVDFVFGTDNLFELPRMLRKVHKGEKITKTQRYDRQKVRNFIPEYTYQELQHSGILKFLKSIFRNKITYLLPVISLGLSDFFALVHFSEHPGQFK